MTYLFVWLIFINLIAIIIYRSDKNKSEKGKWRTKETNLLLFPLFGGGIGSTIGMYVFRHKTKKIKFVFGVPILTIVSIVIIYALFYYKIIT